VNRTPEAAGSKDDCAMLYIVSCRTYVPANSEYSGCLESSGRSRSLAIRWRHVDASSSRLFKDSARKTGIPSVLGKGGASHDREEATRTPDTRNLPL
jgi:hypothetical protein